MSKLDTSITIPAKHYVTMIRRGNATVPLGFATPWGEDAAAKKRMQTADSWAGSSRKDALPSTIIENEPMSGFKLTAGIRTGDYGAADKWRIEDPRGFELEITSTNLAQILIQTTIERGEILDQCVWGRIGGNNILITIESQAYKDAVAMTKIATSSSSWDDVKLGNTVTLKNGITGRYLGKASSMSEDYGSREVPFESKMKISKPAVVILVETPNEYRKTEKELKFIGSPKLSSVVNENEITLNEAEQLIQSLIADPKVYAVNGYRDIIAAYSGSMTLEKLTLSVEDAPNVTDIWNTGAADYGLRDIYVTVPGSLQLGVVLFDRYRQNKNKIEKKVKLVDMDKFSEGKFGYLRELDRKHSYYYRDKDNYSEKVLDLTDMVGVDDLKPKAVYATVTTKLGNTVKVSI